MSSRRAWDQPSELTAHRTALCYEPVAPEATVEAENAAKDTSHPSTRVKPTTGFVSPTLGPTLLIKPHKSLLLPETASGHVPCLPKGGTMQARAGFSIMHFPSLKQRHYPWAGSPGPCPCVTSQGLPPSITATT